MTVTRISVRERLLKHVQYEPNTGCWLWSGAGRDGRYGHIGEGGRGGKTLSVHRLSYEVHVGPVPSGMVVMHRCDTPQCVNPDHLRVGTYLDNSADMLSKGRHRSTPSGLRGERHGGAKLTEEDVATIRALYVPRKTTRALAERFGIDPSNVRLIASRKAWRHVP